MIRFPSIVRAARPLVVLSVCAAMVAVLVCTSAARAEDVRKAARKLLPTTVAVQWKAKPDAAPAAGGQSGQPAASQPKLPGVTISPDLGGGIGAAPGGLPKSGTFTAGFGFDRGSSAAATPEISMTSGTLVSANGFLVTAAGETGKKGEFTVTLHDGRKLPARLAASDQRTKLQLLKVEAGGLPHVEFASSPAEIGQPVATVMRVSVNEPVVSEGIVAATERTISGFKIELLQTDLATYAGSAGAPLADLEGRVLGILVANTSSSARREGAAFAVPAEYAQSLLAKAEDEEQAVIESGFLGVTLKSDDDIVTVTDVREDSPAQAVGFKVGDVVLVVDGKEMSTAAEVTRRIGRKTPGEAVTINIRRGEERKQIEVVLGRRPQEKPAPPTQSPNISAVTPGKIFFYGLDGKPQQAPAGMDMGFPGFQPMNGFPGMGPAAPSTGIASLRVERSDLDKKLDALSTEVQSLKKLVQELAGEVKRLNEPRE